MIECDKTWVRQHVDEVLSTPPPADIADGYDVSIFLAIDIYIYAATYITYTSSDPKHRVLESMMYGQELWEYLCDYIETVDNTIVCQKFGYLSVLMSLSKDKDKWFQDAVQYAASEILKKRGTLLFRDPVPVFPTMSQDEVNRIIDDFDANLVTEFFELFKEIKVFYVDPEKYDDPADVERHRKMMAIFNKMTQDSDK